MLMDAMDQGRPSCLPSIRNAAGGQRGFLEVLLEVVLAQDLGPVGEHARLGHGVEDADVGLGDVELFAALHADEQLLGGVGPGPAHPVTVLPVSAS